MVITRGGMQFPVFFQQVANYMSESFPRGIHLSAESPHNDTGVIAVAPDHLFCSLALNSDVLWSVFDLFAYEQLLQNQDSQLVAGFHPGRVLRVAAGPEKIAAHLLDQPHISRMNGVWQCIAQTGIRLVPYGPLQLQPLSVKKEASVGIELKPSEAQRGSPFRRYIFRPLSTEFEGSINWECPGTRDVEIKGFAFLN